MWIKDLFKRIADWPYDTPAVTQYKKLCEHYIDKTLLLTEQVETYKRLLYAREQHAKLEKLNMKAKINRAEQKEATDGEGEKDE